VANCARDRNRLRAGRNVGLDSAEAADCDFAGPLESAAGREESGRMDNLLARLPYEQREVIVLHLHHEMRFRQIADVLGVSINTVQSRYRYGLDKLRSILNSMVTE
jgi:RNA polymerase sigma-70 factor (ECF subfamily)